MHAGALDSIQVLTDYLNNLNSVKSNYGMILLPSITTLLNLPFPHLKITWAKIYKVPILHKFKTNFISITLPSPNSSSSYFFLPPFSGSSFFFVKAECRAYRKMPKTSLPILFGPTPLPDENVLPVTGGCRNPPFIKESTGEFYRVSLQGYLPTA